MENLDQLFKLAILPPPSDRNHWFESIYSGRKGPAHGALQFFQDAKGGTAPSLGEENL